MTLIPRVAKLLLRISALRNPRRSRLHPSFGWLLNRYDTRRKVFTAIDHARDPGKIGRCSYHIDAAFGRYACLLDLCPRYRRIPGKSLIIMNNFGTRRMSDPFPGLVSGGAALMMAVYLVRKSRSA